MKYDYLIVGAGLFGTVFARQAYERGKKCLVIDKRDHIGGNVYTEKIEGINVHKYGAHIFHTNNKEVWDYVNRFVTFNRFTNSPVANYKGELYSLPFNMYTFNKMWGVVTPLEAIKKIEEQRKEIKVSLLISKSRQSVLSEETYMKSLLKDTLKNSGEETAKNFRRLLLRDSLSDSLLITTILMHFIREFLLEDIQSLLRKCSMELK